METIHGNFAAYLFKTVLNEDANTLKQIDTTVLSSQISAVMREIIAHEDAVIEYTFGDEVSINDITRQQLKLFIRSRADMCLNLLGYPSMYEIEEDPISEWFYKSSNSIKIHDFFSGGTNQYRRSWKFDEFSRIPFIGAAHE